jgi:preprotein translocase subunit SecE
VALRKEIAMAMREARAEPRVAGREGKASAAVGGWLAGVRTFPQQTKTFLSEVRAETQRVTWPTRKQIRVTTVVVIVTVFFFGFYFAVLDYIFSDLIGRLLRWGG